MDELLVTPEVASLCRVTPPTVRYWRMRGLGPPSFNLNGRVVYRRGAVLTWIAQREQATTHERELTA